jgi:hypothetical protein
VALSCRRLAGFSQNNGIYWAVSESCNFEKPRDSSQVLSTFHAPTPLKSGKRTSLSRSTRKSHECGLAAMGFRLKGEL